MYPICDEDTFYSSTSQKRFELVSILLFYSSKHYTFINLFLCIANYFSKSLGVILFKKEKKTCYVYRNSLFVDSLFDKGFEASLGYIYLSYMKLYL